MVKAGYKQTDIGIIPKDWGLDPVCKIVDNIIDYRGVTPTKLGMTWGNGEIKALSAGNVKKGWIDFATECYLGSEDLYTRWMRNGDPKIDDIVFTLEAPLGNLALLPNNDKYILSQRTILLQLNQQTINPRFCFQYFISNSFQSYISNIATGSTAQGMKRKSFEQIKIPLPPLPEQVAIATVLSNIDELITSLTELIAKKKQIKQGTMQKLLRPQADWEVRKLGDILDYKQPTKYLVTNTEYLDNAKTPVLTAGKTFVLGHTNEEFGIFDNLPVIIFDDFTTATKYVDFPFKAKSSAMKMLIPRNRKTNLKLIFELMNRVDFIVGDHKRHWISEYQNLTIPYPDPQTQTKIATILTDMDEEITTLETKLAKYEHIKQGAMQELLTGRIRLV